MIRISIATLGCKTNQAESAIILNQFDANNMQLVPWDTEADIYIVNTCTVTNRTDYKSRYLIRQALQKKAEYPLAKVVVTGCFAQRSPEETALLGAVDLIVDNQHKLDIATLLAVDNYHFSDIMTQDTFSYKPTRNMGGHTRAFQKIQDGCDFYCSYCAVPYARGHSRSASFSQVLEQAELFVQSGFKEIVLGGVNLGLYRDGKYDLADVVMALSRIKGLELIRLSSIEPQLFTPRLIETIGYLPKICPHFHIPLQSGQDDVLRSMQRRYTTDMVRNLVADILAVFPSAAIGFDVITGFPGETEVQHQQTVNFLQSLPLAYLHVFSYSKRKGTPAAEMPNQVLKPEKTRRTTELTLLSEQFQKQYRRLLVNSDALLRGIIESQSNGISEFLSDHFLRVTVSDSSPIGSLCTVSAGGMDVMD